MAAKMYISTGGPIVIGDTITGNQHSGERYFLYTKREAEQAYREKHGLQGKHFQKIMVDPTWFGYIVEKPMDFECITVPIKVTGAYTSKMANATVWHIKFEPEKEIELTICDEKNEASFYACTWEGPNVEDLIGRRCMATMVRNMAWHLNLEKIEIL